MTFQIGQRVQGVIDCAFKPDDATHGKIRKLCNCGLGANGFCGVYYVDWYKGDNLIKENISVYGDDLYIPYSDMPRKPHRLTRIFS